MGFTGNFRSLKKRVNKFLKTTIQATYKFNKYIRKKRRVNDKLQVHTGIRSIEKDLAARKLYDNKQWNQVVPLQPLAFS